MTPFLLVETTTSDKLLHQGIFYQPKRSSDTALLWIHGLTSTFSAHIPIWEQLATQCEKHGFGFAAFNNRGHDAIIGIKKLDKRLKKGYTRYPGGAGQEVFTESKFDIESGINFLVSQGYDKVIVAGHSTGANKICYYAATFKNSHLAGVILISPMSDRSLTLKENREVQKTIPIMQKLIKEGKGDIPTVGLYEYPITPRRYLSLLLPGMPEETFDYTEKNPKMKLFSKIKKPLFVIFGEKDEYARPNIGYIKSVFDSKATSKNYHSIILPGDHSFHGEERILAKEVTDWVNSPT